MVRRRRVDYAAQDAVGAFVRVSSRTGAPKTIGRFPVGLQLNTCDLTRERDTMICSLTEEQTDAWVMENLDPDIP